METDSDKVGNGGVTTRTPPKAPSDLWPKSTLININTGIPPLKFMCLFWYNKCPPSPSRYTVCLFVLYCIVLCCIFCVSTLRVTLPSQIPCLCKLTWPIKPNSDSEFWFWYSKSQLWGWSSRFDRMLSRLSLLFLRLSEIQKVHLLDMISTVLPYFGLPLPFPLNMKVFCSWGNSGQFQVDSKQ